MHLITYFAPKGGSGRTTAMMTTASGLVAAGHSVAVLDLTEQARPGWASGVSFISQWEDRMVETGAKADQLVTAPAWDHETAAKALDRFFREKFEYVLVDTAKRPDPISTWIMNQSDLVIVPMRGSHEATWSSNWLAANRYPKHRTYGLVTGASDQNDERWTRMTFTAGPMLHSSLKWLATIGSQFETGLLHVQRRFDEGVSELEPNQSLRSRLDWVAAYHAANALCCEIKHLLECQTYPAYVVNAPLATGSTFAHLHALLEQPSYT
ncbi:division plane positioning ATPase MipZ [Aliiroseovarius sp. CAU 1755]